LLNDEIKKTFQTKKEDLFEGLGQNNKNTSDFDDIFSNSKENNQPQVNSENIFGFKTKDDKLIDINQNIMNAYNLNVQKSQSSNLFSQETDKISRSKCK